MRYAYADGGRTWLRTRHRRRITVLQQNHFSVGFSFPEFIDVNIDILVQGRADTFQRQLTSALRTRGVYGVLMQKQPTLTEVMEENGAQCLI